MMKRSLTMAVALVALNGVRVLGEDGHPNEASPLGLRNVIRVNDRMLNLDEEVTVASQGKELYKGRIRRSIGTLAKTLAERGGSASIFSGEIVVTLTEKTE